MAPHRGRAGHQRRGRDLRSRPHLGGVRAAAACGGGDDMKPAALAFAIALTVGAYALSRAVARRYRSPLTTPVFFSTPIVIAGLLLTGMTLDDYAPAKDFMLFLLGPATVALAIPLHENGRALLSHALPALAGLATGA